jgi:betaine-aldehyde dehydrogenase
MDSAADHDHWINAKSVRPRNGARISRYSPADGRLIANAAAGTAEDVREAARAARDAFDRGPWTSYSGAERGERLGRLADLMQRDREGLARVEAEEAGKPIVAARMEIGVAIGLTRYAASLAWNISGRLITQGGPGRFGLVIQEPRGVAGLIVAWNYPALCLMQKLPYALAAGCAVVIKPSELTAGTTLMIARLASEAGVPDGQINVVIGTGEVVGEALTSDTDIAMISFTGSTRIGRRVAAKCATGGKHCSVELGGKGANIIFADADIDAAVEATYLGFTFNKGEECCSSARILVEREIAPLVTEKLIARSRKARIGMPLDETTDMGPMIHAQHLARVLDYIAKAKLEGGHLLTGGEQLREGDLAMGCFLPPTLFDHVTPAMTIFREEIFGPVACIVTFDSIDDALRLANDTEYGLANGVWTRNIDRALTVVARLRSGMVYVNTYFETLPQLPLGGLKASGAGHENGPEGLGEFLQTRSAFIRSQTPQ